MTAIIRGTTPTFKKTFDIVDPSDITVAILTVRGSKINIEKNLSDAVVGEDYIAWTLTQADSLSFGDTIGVMVNWKLQDGTRGATPEKVYTIKPNHKEIEI